MVETLVVAPEEPVRVGRSPHRCGGSGDQRVSYACRRVLPPATTGRWRNGSAAPCKEKVAGSNPARSTEALHADVAQRKRRGAQTAVSAGSTPPSVPTGRGATGAPASEAGGWEFESLRPDRARAVRGGGNGTMPVPETGGPGSSPGLAANDASAVVAHLDSRVGLLRRWGFLHGSCGCGFESRRLRA